MELNYASPSSGEAYRGRQLTTNFELWVEIFCVPTCFHMRIPKPSPSVYEYYSIETQRVDFFFFFLKFEIGEIKIFCPYPEKRNRPGFVDISPTLVIDTSMERSSRVLQHGNPKIWFFFQKNLKLNFDMCQRAEIVQVGLNKYLYDDIGDASSSLRGSTSSFFSGPHSPNSFTVGWWGKYTYIFRSKSLLNFHAYFPRCEFSWHS